MYTGLTKPIVIYNIVIVLLINYEKFLCNIILNIIYNNNNNNNK